MLQTLVVPRLSLAGVQSLGQACRATHASVNGLSDNELRQLAQV